MKNARILSRIAKNMYALTLVLLLSAAALPVQPVHARTSTYSAVDFSLTLPASWKGNYRTARTEDNGVSYVAFYAKKCYQQTKQGWLFSIARFRDDSYEDTIPSYALIGTWNKIHYVVVYPTDVQTEGATKAAAKQYNKMLRQCDTVVQSIKKKKTLTFQAPDFTLTLPLSWKGNYKVVKDKNTGPDTAIAFYGKKCYNQTKQGWLFSIIRFSDDSYKELPYYDLLGTWNGLHYVASYPTDVQSEGATKSAVKQYGKLSRQTELVVKTIQRKSKS